MEAYKREQEEIFRAQRETMQRENPPPQPQQQFEELERKSTFLSEDLFKFNFFKGSESYFFCFLKKISLFLDCDDYFDFIFVKT